MERKSLLLVMIVLVVAVFWPTEYNREVRLGDDTYEAHHPIYGSRKIIDTFSSAEKVVGIGSVLVDLRRSDNLREIEVVVSDVSGVEVARGLVNASEIKDDKFAFARLDKAIDSTEEFTVSFSSINATNNNPVGVRFDLNDDQPSLALIERIPVWKQVLFWAREFPERAKNVARLIIGSIVLSGVLLLAERRGGRWWSDPFHLLLGGVFLVSILIRWPIATQIESAFGGDAFNYLLQSKDWVTGHNPFSSEWRRKAPLMSFLLLPAWFSFIDPMWWGRILNVLVSSGTAVLLALLLVRLSVSRSLALGGALLLVVNRMWVFESVHGLANPLYSLLILAAIYALTFYKKKHGRYWIGVLSGLVTLARFEGGLVVVSLVSSVWALDRFRIKTLGYILLPVIVLLLVPFLMWPVTGEVGVRPPSDIAADGGLYLIGSVEDFQNNFKSFTKFFGRTWILTELVGKQWQWFGVAFLAGIVLETIRKKQKVIFNTVVLIFPYALIGLMFFNVMRDTIELDKILVLVLAALTGYGVGYYLTRNPKWVLPVLLLVVFQILLVTAILPKPRYFLQLIPLMVMAILLAISSFGFSHIRMARIGTLLCVGVLVVFVYLKTVDTMSGAISEYNEKSHDHTVVLRAVKWLVPLKGSVAVVEESDLPVRTYLPSDRHRILIKSLADRDEVDEQWNWVVENEVDYLIETTAQPAFFVVDKYSDRIIEVGRFGTRFAETEAVVYKVLFAK